MRKILILLIAFGIGIVIGLWYGVSVEDISEKISESPNIYIQIKIGERSGFGYFIRAMFACLCLSALVFLFSLHPILSYFSVVIPLYLGYCLSYEIILMLRLCGISAIILAILGILLYRMISGIGFVLLCAAAIERAASFASRSEMLKIIGMTLIVILVLLILMSIVIPFCCRLLVYNS